eukprot:1970199-Rhodomonas_salina.1
MPDTVVVAEAPQRAVNERKRASSARARENRLLVRVALCCLVVRSCTAFSTPLIVTQRALLRGNSRLHPTTALCADTTRKVRTLGSRFFTSTNMAESPPEASKPGPSLLSGQEAIDHLLRPGAFWKIGRGVSFLPEVFGGDR